MIKFIPPYLGEVIKSNAEKKMFEVLQTLELKNAYILHSLGLPKHKSKMYGEIDFVIVCERGIACLEIKGGMVECREGCWIFRDRYGAEHRKAEGPFAQVIGNMFSLKTAMKEQFPKEQFMKNILFACGVVFPDIVFESHSEEIISEMVYDRRVSDVSKYINDIFDYWEKRQHYEVRKLSPKDINRIVGYLRSDFVFLPTLGERLETIDQKLVRLTREQALILNALSSNKHLLIQGAAGTGKTILAMEFAKQKCSKGEKVLYLTYNKNLANEIIRRFTGQEHIKVINIHALFGEYVKVDTERIAADPTIYFMEQLPEEFMNVMDTMSKSELKDLQYDCIVMDEGQDIVKPNYLYALDYLLRGGLTQGRWAVFYDEMQNIYNPEFAEGMDLLETVPNTKFKLFINCRNTVQIGTFNSKISNIELSDFLKENGEDVQLISYHGDKDYPEKILQIVKELRKENVPMEDVVFLSPKRLLHSKLSELDVKQFEVRELSGMEEIKKDIPVYATIPGFKGLDSKVVILIDLEQVSAERFQKYLYIGCSRARSLLYVIAEESLLKSILN